MKIREKLIKIKEFFAAWTAKQKIVAIAIICAFLVVLALGLSLGLTLPIKSVTAEGGAVLLAGEEYDGGLFLVVTRRSGKKTRVEVKPYMLSPFDTQERGEKDVTVTYKNRSIPATVLVVSLEETECSVRVGSMKTEYEPNEAISTGGILDLSYKDKPFRSFPITPDLISGFDSAKSGEYEATVTFRGSISCVYRYTVMKIIKSLEAAGKLYAEQGAPLTKENVMGNGTILVTYTDLTTEHVSIYNEYVEIKTSWLEERAENYQTTLELSYRGKTFVFNAEAYLKGEQYAIENMELTLPKRVYKVGEKPDLEETFLSVKYRYYTGSVRVALTEEMVVTKEPFESPGEQVEFTISYMGISESATVRVVSDEDSKRITGLSTLWRGAADGRLYLGDALTFGDYTLMVEYGYGYSHKSVPLTAEYVSGYDPNTPGLQDLTLTYQGFSATQSVTVVSPDDSDVLTEITGLTGWEDKTYKTSPALVIPSGARLTLEFGYGARTGSVLLSDAAVSIEGFSPGVVGSQRITIRYKGKSLEYNVNVADDTVLGITGLSIKMQEYDVGEAFDPEKCVVVLDYEGGKRQEEKTLAALIPLGATYSFDDPVFDPNVPDSYVIRVSYQGFSDFGWVVVRMQEITLSGIWVDTSGGKTTFAVGEGLDISGYVLYANYSDGSSTPVFLTYDMIGGYDSSEKGTFYASVSFGGLITYFSYTIA